MTKISFFEALPVPIDHVPIERSWMIFGDPMTQAQELARSDDGQVTTGVWSTTSGRFYWHYGEDETIHILEGEAQVRDRTSPVPHHLSKGATVFFPAGSSAEWVVAHYVRKLFVIRTPKISLPRRLVRKARAFLR